MPRPVRLFGFEDDDFSMYPCIRIPETNYTIDEYEAIANTLLRMLASDDSQVFSKAARGIAVLAYNTLMDPGDKREADPRPFFHKHNETEPWIRYRDEPAIDLAELRELYPARQDGDPSLRLLKTDSSEFWRKSSIGAWAFCHLRAFGQNSQQDLRKSTTGFYDRRGRKLLFRGRHFLSTYEMPALSEIVYSSLKNEYKNQRNTEILYLFFRAAIVLEQNYDNPSQRRLLEGIAFGGCYGLRYGGLWLWHDFNKAHKKLNAMDMLELCDCIDWALADINSISNPDRSRAVLEKFRMFYVEYVMRPLPGDNQTQRSRYFMYAHIVDDDYFYWIGSREFLELSDALHLISGVSVPPPPSPYKEWGEAIAARVRTRDNDLVTEVV